MATVNDRALILVEICWPGRHPNAWRGSRLGVALVVIGGSGTEETPRHDENLAEPYRAS
jgi:hypothetical protein